MQTNQQEQAHNAIQTLPSVAVNK